MTNKKPKNSLSLQFEIEKINYHQFGSERIHFHEFVSSAVPEIQYVNWFVNAIDESVTHGNRSLNRNLE